ncbi:7TM domain-containing protein [Aquimarina sp. 2201CG5-10]|uniref:7TM domain-containing protein n=1 Tax=Aquimarina callyspongiae TaxID=3098150 RepID=UPI002AB3C932|nr:7TM domain-containing protein [Aquimarina sp. 2201CG5-10]MDY8137196.1 7TM domain-containing protein [Aquimarina sp. 2201CG5-10]
MNSKTNFKIIVISISILALVSIGIKIKPVLDNYDNFNPEEVYKVNYNYFFKSANKNTVVKSYVPESNPRQRISHQKNISDHSLSFYKEPLNGGNERAVWKTDKNDTYYSLNYEFIFEGKEKRYFVPNDFKRNNKGYELYTLPTKNIQSEDSKIGALAAQLSKGAKNDKQVIKNIFDHVVNIPSAPIITLTDALTAIEQNKASCNGKSRLFAALTRNLGYPTRIKAGIILEKTNKRTSHAWVEIRINDQWVPFDGLNNHFAYLPANYLEIYIGDESFITHTANIQFDYTYQIDKVNHIAFLNMSNDQISALPGFSLWKLIDKGIIPMNSLRLLLLLPLGGLLVAFLRNIVGIKTFGVFLPALIAFSLIHTGFVAGIILFVALILLVGLISYPFDKIGLLYTPKLVISLTVMVTIMILAAYIGLKYNITWLTTLTFFPTIILTIAAERFSRSTVEDGYKIAIDKLVQTLIATAICYAVLSASWLPSILVIFPEIILLVITTAMILGRYIGIRWIEFYRFKPLLVAPVNK